MSVKVETPFLSSFEKLQSPHVLIHGAQEHAEQAGDVCPGGGVTAVHADDGGETWTGLEFMMSRGCRRGRG